MIIQPCSFREDAMAAIVVLLILDCYFLFIDLLWRIAIFGNKFLLGEVFRFQKDLFSRLALYMWCVARFGTICTI